MSALEQEVAKLLAPLRELQKTAHREEQAAQGKLDEARERRREIDKMLRAIDPEAVPFHKNGGKKKKATGGGSHKYTEERVVEATTWAQEHAEQLNAMNDGDGFYATEVMREFPDRPVEGQSGLAAMFVQLHDRGVLRLSKVGGLGGRKYYKVVV